jgi:hypothetical protein
MFGKDDLTVETGCIGQTLQFGNNYKMPEVDDYNIFGGFESMTYLTNEEAYVFTITEMETFQVFLY